jgi:hypothetical protein
MDCPVRSWCDLSEISSATMRNVEGAVVTATRENEVESEKQMTLSAGITR